MDELRANVDFAYDIGSEGMVIHIIGTPRGIPELGKKELEAKGIDTYYLIDKNTGKLLGAISASEQIQLPKLRYNPNTKKYEFIYDPETGGVKHYERQTFQDYINMWNKQGKDGLREAINHFMHQQAIKLEGQWRYYKRWGDQANETIQNLELIDDYVRDPEGTLRVIAEREGEERMKRFKRWWFKEGNRLAGVDKDTLEEIRREREREREMSMTNVGSAWQQWQDTLKRIENQDIVSMTDYAKEGNIDGIVDLAKHSMQQYQKRMRLYKEGKIKEKPAPIMIQPENIFPRFYGSHPDELRDVIQNARRKFMEEAKVDRNTAEKFIGATFDIGHAAMWRRYWKGTDEEFNEWLIKESEKLAEEGIIGKVHITDSFGYEDDHLAPGEGITPVKKVMDAIKKKLKGKVPIISEGYGQRKGQEWRQITEAWRTFNPHLYNQAYFQRTGAPEMWDRLQYFTLSRTYSPSFLAGGAAPSEDFRTWSDLPLE